MSEENGMFEHSEQTENNSQQSYEPQQENHFQPDLSSQSQDNNQQNYSSQMENNYQQNYNSQTENNNQQNYNSQGYNNDNYNQYEQPSSGFGIASMVCGILALVTCCLWCTCIPLAVVSIVLGILQIQKGTAKGMSIAGIVCSAIALILFFILTVWGNYLQSSGAYYELLRELQEMQY
ncbi:MAG: DUF4190 domain-containing protein [Lachnospiraceae bacterium]|nr:DUF4190 domain-containing protein [Lachnospiraceae bacterium]